MLTLHSTAHSEYVLHDNGIHEFIYKDTNRVAVDEVFDYQREAIGSVKPGETLRQIISFTRSLPPIGQIFRQMKDVPMTGPASRFPKMRIAILYKDPSTITLLNVTTDTLRLVAGVAIQYFPIDDREKATQWLLES